MQQSPIKETILCRRGRQRDKDKEDRVRDMNTERQRVRETERQRDRKTERGDVTYVCNHIKGLATPSNVSSQ